MSYGGEGGIRTPDTLSGMSAFEADRFNHSRTSPRREGRVVYKKPPFRRLVEFYQICGPAASGDPPRQQYLFALRLLLFRALQHPFAQRLVGALGFPHDRRNPPALPVVMQEDGIDPPRERLLALPVPAFVRAEHLRDVAPLIHASRHLVLKETLLFEQGVRAAHVIVNIQHARAESAARTRAGRYHLCPRQK